MRQCEEGAREPCILAGNHIRPRLAAPDNFYYDEEIADSRKEYPEKGQDRTKRIAGIPYADCVDGVFSDGQTTSAQGSDGGAGR